MGTALTKEPRRRSVWTVAGASFAGTTVEYYDFFIYGTAAALVFPQLFFPAGDPFLSALASFGSFAAGFITRPLGGIIFGHFGDRVGRKTMLMITLMIMVIATAGIGLLPTYDGIGLLAPVLLVTLRLVQGIAFGGEMGGAILMAYEYAPKGRGGFFASLPQTGPAVGVVLGNAAFLPVAALPQDDLHSWGWRVPFLFSLVLVGIGLIVRLKIAESPKFAHVKRAGAAVKVPLVDALRRYPLQIVLVTGGMLGFGLYTSVVFTYMVGYASENAGVARSTILTIILVSTAFQIVTIPLAGALSDKIGRRATTIGGAVASCAGIFVLFALVDTGRPLWILIGYLAVMGLGYSLGYGAIFALFVEAFGVRVRYSGMSLGLQLANVFGSALGPGVATILLRATGTSMGVAGYVAVVMVITLASLVALNKIVLGSGHAARMAADAAEEVEAPAEVGSDTSRGGLPG